MPGLFQTFLNWFRRPGRKGQAPAARPDRLQAIEQTVIGRLLASHGLRPLYIEGVESESEAQARAADLPLFYVWGEHQTEGGIQFVFGLNGLVVTGALAAHANPDSALFKQAKARIERKLHKVAYDALVSECDQLGLRPSDLLDVQTLE